MRGWSLVLYRRLEVVLMDAGDGWQGIRRDHGVPCSEDLRPVCLEPSLRRRAVRRAT